MSLKVNDLYLNDDLSIANCMNSYFSSVFIVEDHENFSKDRGVTINYDLSWGKHVSYIVNKVSEVLGIVRRSLGNYNRYAFSCLFKSLVDLYSNTLSLSGAPTKKRILNPWKK